MSQKCSIRLSASSVVFKVLFQNMIMCIWAPFLWNQKILKAYGLSGALVGLQGSYDLDMGHKGPVIKGLGASGP